jgi:hypothetical protein
VDAVPPDRREVLLVEYQKAQDSAEHHDRLVWTVTSLNWVGSAVLMGFVLSALGSDRAPSGSYKAALIAISGIGIVLSCLVWRWARQFRRFKNVKYARCKEIEVLFDMEQHSKFSWRPQDPSSSPLAPWVARLLSKARRRLQATDYTILMCAFLGAWVFVLIAVARA